MTFIHPLPQPWLAWREGASMSAGRLLVREPEMQDIAIRDDIILAFEPQLAGIARAGFALERHVIRIGDRLGPDKTLLEIGMDHARRLRCLGALRDRPGASLLRSHCEVGEQAQELVPGADDAVQPRLVEPDRLEVF